MEREVPSVAKFYARLEENASPTQALDYIYIYRHDRIKERVSVAKR